MPRPTPNPAFPVVVLIDTREQLPYSFDGITADAEHGGGTWQVRTEVRGIPSGDYSLDGFADRVAVERKSVADLFGTIGAGRDRFVRELERLDAMPYAAVVVEGDWREVTGTWPTELAALRAGLVAAAEADGPIASAPWAQWLKLLDAATPGPPARSKLSPRTVYRSVIAWQQRYPRVHWWFCPSRTFAEVTALRVLERFLKETTK